MAQSEPLEPHQDDQPSDATATVHSQQCAQIHEDHGGGGDADRVVDLKLERRLRLKVDIRLCTIAGILCSLNLLDSGILSSASVTTMLGDLGLEGNRYSVSIFIFTVASVVCQLPCTIAVRLFGPRIWISSCVSCFGLITLCTAFVQSWRQMIALRVLLGIATSGIYPGLVYLISTWYTRKEQQLRFAFLQAGQVTILATGGMVNYGLNHLNGRAGLQGWRWMFLVQGVVTMCLGFISYWWMIDFPENASQSFRFLTDAEGEVITRRIQADRQDVIPEKFSWFNIAVHFLDPKLYGFSILFFQVNLVTTCLAYFLPIILQSGMGFSENQAILLNAPPYYYSAIPVLLTSLIGDTYRIRGPIIVFNALCLIAGMLMLGLASQVTVRYVGTFLATGAYVSNFAALYAYQSNNIVGQWKRVTTVAVSTAFNGLGGIAGSYIVKNNEAPLYRTAIWVCVGSHVLMILTVAAFTVHFYVMNQKQKRGGSVLIESLAGFRYTY